MGQKSEGEEGEEFFKDWDYMGVLPARGENPSFRKGVEKQGQRKRDGESSRLQHLGRYIIGTGRGIVR